MNILIEIQSFPSIIWYKNSFKSRYTNLLSCDAYKKMSFRNRYLIAGSNGLISLSIPVEQGRNQKTAMKDVRISYRQNWQKIHRISVLSCYNKSPFLDYYRDGLEKFYSGKWNFLFDWNMEIILWLNQVLGYQGEVRVWETISEVEKQSMTDFRDQFLPKHYMRADTKVVYPQVFEDRTGFQPNLSVIDLLFNTGPGAKSLLQ